jgi:hypothetical protein
MAIPLQSFPYPFPAKGFNTETITVTLRISLHYSTHKDFKSHVTSSLVDFLILLLLRTSRGYLLPRTDWLVAPIIFKITPLHGPYGKHRLHLFRMCLQLRCLATDVLLFLAFVWRGPHRKHVIRVRLRVHWPISSIDRGADDTENIKTSYDTTI